MGAGRKFAAANIADLPVLSAARYPRIGRVIRKPEFCTADIALFPMVDAVCHPFVGGVLTAVKFCPAGFADLPVLFAVCQPGFGCVRSAIELIAADLAHFPVLFAVREPFFGGMLAAVKYLAADVAHLPMLLAVRQPGFGGMRGAFKFFAADVALLPVVDAVFLPSFGSMFHAAEFFAAGFADLPMFSAVCQPGLGGVRRTVKRSAADLADFPVLFAVRQPFSGGMLAAVKGFAADVAHLPMLFAVRQPGLGGVCVQRALCTAHFADAAVPFGGSLPNVTVRRRSGLAGVRITAVCADAVALAGGRTGRSRILDPFAVGMGEGFRALACRFTAGGADMVALAGGRTGRGRILDPFAPAVSAGGDHFVCNAPADGALAAHDAFRCAGRVARHSAFIPAVLCAVGRFAADGALAPVLLAVRVPAAVAVARCGDALRFVGAAALVCAGMPPFARGCTGRFDDDLPLSPVVFRGGQRFGARSAAYEAGVFFAAVRIGRRNRDGYAGVPAVLGAVERFAAHRTDVPVRLFIRLPLYGSHMPRRGDGLCPCLAAGGTGILQFALFRAGRRAHDGLCRQSMFAEGQRARFGRAALVAPAHLFARRSAVRFGSHPPIAPNVAGCRYDLALHFTADGAGVLALSALRAGGRL